MLQIAVNQPCRLFGLLRNFTRYHQCCQFVKRSFIIPASNKRSWILPSDTVSNQRPWITSELAASNRRLFSTSSVFQAIKQSDDAVTNREVEAMFYSEKSYRLKVRVIGLDGEDLGVMKLGDAKKKASAENLKVTPKDTKSSPPVYQLITGKQLMMLQIEKKKTSKGKTKVSEKAMKVKSSINDHDLDIKKDQFVEWIKKGHSVKVTIKAPRKNKPEEEKSAEIAAVFKSFSESVVEVALLREVLKNENELHFHARPKPELLNTESKDKKNVAAKTDNSDVDKVESSDKTETETDKNSETKNVKNSGKSKTKS